MPPERPMPKEMQGSCPAKWPTAYSHPSTSLWLFPDKDLVIFATPRHWTVDRAVHCTDSTDSPRILLRLKWREQDVQDKTEQRDHRALTASDSLPQSIRIGFPCRTRF